MTQLIRILLFCLMITVSWAQTNQPVSIKFTKVNDQTGLDNPWHIKQHLPDLWTGILDTLSGLHVQADNTPTAYSLEIDLKQIYISKYHVGNPLVGGYQGYQTKIVSECRLIKNSDHKVVINWTLNTDLTDRQLGFTVLAKGVKHALTFAELDTLKFHSAAFEKSLVYRGLVIQGQNLRKKLADYFGLETDQKQGLGPYKVLITRGPDFHINAGSAEGLVKGQAYSIYTEGAVILDKNGVPLGRESVRMGTASVMAVKGNHLTWLQFADKSLNLPNGTEVYLQ